MKSQATRKWLCLLGLVVLLGQAQTDMDIRPEFPVDFPMKTTEGPMESTTSAILLGTTEATTEAATTTIETASTEAGQDSTLPPTSAPATTSTPPLSTTTSTPTAFPTGYSPWRPIVPNYWDTSDSSEGLNCYLQEYEEPVNYRCRHYGWEKKTVCLRCCCYRWATTCKKVYDGPCSNWHWHTEEVGPEVEGWNLSNALNFMFNLKNINYK